MTEFAKLTSGIQGMNKENAVAEDVSFQLPQKIIYCPIFFRVYYAILTRFSNNRSSLTVAS